MLKPPRPSKGALGIERPDPLQAQHLIGGLILADESGELIDWSPTALRLHGFTSLDEVRQHVAAFTTLFELFDGDGTKLTVEQWPLPRLIRGETVDNMELRLHRIDTNQQWWINYSGAVTQSPDSERRIFVLLLQDVTEWRRAIAALQRTARSLRESEQRLRDNQMLLQTLVEGMPDPVYVKQANGRFRYANAAVARLAGRTAGSCTDCDDVDLFGPAIGKAVQAMDQQVLRDDRPLTYEESACIGDQTLHFLTTKVPYRNAEGAVAGLLGISRDITSLKRADDALRHSAQHLRDVLDSLLVSVLVISLDGQISEMNAAARKTLVALGVDPDKAQGQPLLEMPLLLRSRAAREQLHRALPAALSGCAVHLEGLEITQSSGNKASFDVAIAPMRDAERNVTHLILSSVDVTERKRAEALARQQQMELAHMDRLQSMGHMAAGLAHELNQPLGAIANFAAAGKALIANGRLDPSMLGSVFQDVGSEAARAGEIIKRMRGFVKKQLPQPEAVAVDTLVNESLRILNFEFRNAGIAPDLALAPDLPMVLADPIQITQVFVNLVRNAIDAMGDVPVADRRLRVETSAEPDGNVRFSVIDAGHGIPRDKLGRIFEAFYTTKSHGMGMGLALCRIIIEEHGGRIAAETAPDGRGMRFSFTLPPATNG